MHKHRLGYTLDQTILIIAIIAIVVTLVIGTTAWRLISTSDATKAASILRMVEQANQTFKSTYGRWPEEMIREGGDPADATRGPVMNILQTDAVTTWDTSSRIAQKFQAQFEPLMEPTPVIGTIPQHTIGDGGELAQQQMALNPTTRAFGAITTGNYYIIRMTNLSLDTANNLDEIIDGEENRLQGRLRVVSTAGSNDIGIDCFDNAAIAAGALTANVCYLANATDQGW